METDEQRWDASRRAAIWADLERRWDLLIIGGGITGAGIAREAARLGLKVLLVEARDFAWGTSSRSSKMVHGGIRYLANLQFGTTITSVRERDRLLRDGGGLIDPLDFVFPVYADDDRGHILKLRAGLWLYDKLSHTHDARRLSPAAMAARFPGMNAAGLRCGYSYTDAETDDARLVLRVLREAARAGATVLNYAEATALLREGDRVTGATIRDASTGAEVTARARVVVNAAGVWVDKLRAGLDLPRKMRPLRGSHLVFGRDRLPVDAALLAPNKADGRVLYIYPWEGATLVGTTDLDHRDDLDLEPRITGAEVDYLLTAVRAIFPEAGIDRADVVSTYAGVRPVIAHGSADPSKEPRDHAIWHEHGLWTVTGGKLTTFRQIALDTLHKLRRDLPEIPRLASDAPIFEPPPIDLGGALAHALGGAATPQVSLRLLGRYGADTDGLLAAAAGDPEELAAIPGADTRWVELRWAARAEAVVHLEDLLLRRTRVGHVLAEGGATILPRVRAICAAELGWDDARWTAEESAYRALWRRCYALPAADAASTSS